MTSSFLSCAGIAGARYSGHFQRWANRFLDRAGAKDDRQSFHSLRHTFTDALRRAGATGEVIDGILGWSRGNMRDRYGSGPWIKMLAEVVERAEYPVWTYPASTVSTSGHCRRLKARDDRPSSGSSAPKDVHLTPDTGHVRVRGHAPTVVVGSAYVAAAAALNDLTLNAWIAEAPARHSHDDVAEVWSSTRVAKRATAVLALEPKFQALSDAILHLIVEGVEPARPHVGNPDFSEDMLQAFARYEQEQREAKRLRESAKQDRRVAFIEKVFFHSHLKPCSDSIALNHSPVPIESTT